MKTLDINDAAFERFKIKLKPGLKRTRTDCIKDTSLKVGNELVYAKAKDREIARITIPTDDVENQITPAPGGLLIFATRAVAMSFWGEWVVERISLPEVVELLTFLVYPNRLTEGTNAKRRGTDTEMVIDERPGLIITPALQTYRSLDTLLITEMLLKNEPSVVPILQAIDKLESYWIARFLLSQALNADEDQQHVSEYGKRYGLSPSYFRKLCLSIFNDSPKKKLRLWRAARSVLQLIEVNAPISRIANDNGYCSSSHFASEIRMIFGVAPREFKKLKGCDNNG